MAAPNQSILPSIKFKEYTSFPVLAATLLADLGGMPNAIEVHGAGALVLKTLDGVTTGTLTVPADWYRPVQFSEITSCAGSGGCIAYRSPEV